MSGGQTHFKRTRIAPTPSGFLHLGNVMSFVITAGLAHRAGAKILLRIDDMDQDRAEGKYIQDIFDTLNFLEISWDEGPRDAGDFERNFTQVRRRDLYDAYLKKLYENGLVYACNCSRRQLATTGYVCHCSDRHFDPDKKGISWRLRTDNDKPIITRCPDADLINTLPPEMHNFVVKRKDDLPAYQLTSVADDLFYDIDLIVRGNDLRHSTLAQQQLASFLGEAEFNHTVFYHHPLLTAPGGAKLSKSAGATSIRYMRENGRTPADIFTAIATLNGFEGRVATWQQLAEALV
ncbi:MAG TPA: glutamate--tRNA ligase family protein [Mucilaginibacter sp.]|nr:glutamate--tRNA ligase family protein [Mucilaginibacter sp.]